MQIDNIKTKGNRQHKLSKKKPCGQSSIKAFLNKKNK